MNVSKSSYKIEKKNKGGQKKKKKSIISQVLEWGLTGQKTTARIATAQN